MLQEISRTSVPITRNEEASLSWHNNILTVRTEKHIHFYEFSHNLQCLDKNIDLVSCSIAVSKCSPLTGYVPEHFMKEGVSNIDYTEMILDPSLWPHNPELVLEMTNTTDLQWSPVGVLPGNDPALAVLNNIGNVEVYGRGRYEWTSLLDLSEIIKQKYLASGKLKTPKTLKHLKKLAYTLETSAITWGPKLENNSCLFATSQKNGDISIWILLYKDHDLKAECLGDIQTEMGEVVSIMWIPKLDKQFVIVCSNVYGQLFALDCCISDDSFQVKINSINTLWPQKDKMVTKYMCYNIIDDKIVLICNKHRHLMVIIIDKNCQVLTHFVRNVNDYKITDIKSSDCGIFLTTVNCKIYRIMLKVSVSDLDFDLELIQINDSFSTSDMYGIAFSTNNVIWAVALKNRKILHRQRSQKTLDIVFFYVTNLQPDELTLIMQNPTETLTNYWDCIELLRYKTSKTKLMPSIDYDLLYEKADKGIYKLKLYHVFLHFFLSLEKRARNNARKMLPEMSLDIVKEKILTLHASQLITEVQEKCKNNEEMLENLHLDTYYGAKKYIVCYCEKYKRDIGEFINTKELLLKHTPKVEEQNICQSCDEVVRGFTCNSGHFNMFCSVTFTPIDSYDYLVCKSCSSVAQSELYLNNPVCTFCDLHLSDITLPI